MERDFYFRVVRRWWWLCVLAAVVAGSISYRTVRARPVLYQVSTTIEVGSYLDSLNPNIFTVYLAGTLAQTYAKRVTSPAILNATISNLHLTSPIYGLSAIVIPGTSMITLSVTYPDPIIATDIANELATQLIASSPTTLSPEMQQEMTILQNEMKYAQDEVKKAEDEFKTIEVVFNSLNAVDQAVLRSRLTELSKQMSIVGKSLSQFFMINLKLQQAGSANTLHVIDPAHVPIDPLPSPILQTILPPSILAALAALGLGFAIEFLNNTLRSPSEVMPLLDTPLLGAITPFGNKRTYDQKLVAWTQPRSAIAESYRAIRVGLLFREKADPENEQRRFYVITSSGAGEGKSITAANLAVTFANTGMRTLLVDVDLHRPTIHKLLNVPNQKGMSEVWLNCDSSSQLNGDFKAGQNVCLDNLVQKTEIPDLEVITAGEFSTNPSELLDTRPTRDFVQQIIDSQRYDVVIFDTPPALVMTDSSVFAHISKSRVIIVIESGRTPKIAAARLVQQFRDLGIEISGIVLNRLNTRYLGTDYGQYYYSYSHYDSTSELNTTDKPDFAHR